MTTKQTIVSGIKPSGNLHLGNYLGAIRNWVRMQDEVAGAPAVAGDNGGKDSAGRTSEPENGAGKCLFFLADLHAISVPHEPAQLRRYTYEMTAALVACGIDPDRSVVFNQAQVPAHAELQWLLTGTARMGWLNRMTQFKEKSGKNREGASAALFAYPVLQAADVLLYHATHVPVGDDQKQHLELARDIAQKFNNDFCNPDEPLFTLPAAWVPPRGARIMSLRDGTSKMGKSDASDMSRINLADDADAILKKIKKAKTDPEPLPSEPEGLAERAEAANLVGILAAITDTSAEQVLAEHGGQGFGVFKPLLAQALIEHLAPISARFRELSGDGEALDAILARGASRAREMAAPTVAGAYEALGLVRP